MAPNKRSQTPRHSGVTSEPSSPILFEQSATVLFSRPSTHQRRRRLSGSPRGISSAHSPTQDTPTLHRSPVVPDSPASPVEGSGLAHGSRSRRESTSTMRTSSISIDGAPGSTPTGRVSKAKKGKRVHACGFPGCGKVFTRAEHRRRHELNHNPEALFPCTRPGCRKAFHRIDLLHRHQERHDIEGMTDVTSGHLGHTAHMSMASEPPPSSVLPAAVMSSPQGDRSGPRSSAGGLSIGSLVHPQGDYRYGMGTPAFNGFPRQSMHFVPGFTSSDDSLFFTPESSQSPVSEYYGRYPHRQSISSSSSVAAFDPSGASPLIGGNMPGPWPATSAPPSIFPSHLVDEGPYLPVWPYFLWIGACAEADQSPADSSLPISLSDLDGYEWSVLRGELSHAPGILPGDTATGISDTIRWDCLDHYWQYFHPHFPIVHRATFFPSQPMPLLMSAMVAIGSQYDDRPDAQLYSLTLLEIATKLLRRRDSINSRSRLADLQTVFLLEVLGKYCSRRVEVDMSARFRSLFASLDQARRSLATDPLAVFRTLRKQRTSEDITRAHKFWLEQETRRRILQASTVLDAQQVTLFEQTPTIIQHERQRPRRTGPGLQVNASLPCAEELWETSPIEAWVATASNYDSPKTRSSPVILDYFQTQVSWAAKQDACFDDFAPPEAQQASQPGASAARIAFNYHARQMARNTPVRPLLVVSGESWVLGKKLENESEFQDAKRRLRGWVDENMASRTAFWHAMQVIRSRVTFTPLDTVSTELLVSFDDTHMLQEPWTLYLAALVCWAYGFAASRTLESGGHISGAASTTSEPQSNMSRTSSLSSNHPALLDSYDAAYSAREYLRATDVANAGALLRLDPETFGRMHGLLEIMRLHKIGGFLGGLMNEAERVLYRLVEGRSRLSHF